MDFKKAKEIVKDSEVRTVTYKGDTVWIKDLDPNTQTAIVTSLQKEMKVPIQELHEFQS